MTIIELYNKLKIDICYNCGDSLNGFYRIMNVGKYYLACSLDCVNKIEKNFK